MKRTLFSGYRLKVTVFTLIFIIVRSLHFCFGGSVESKCRTENIFLMDF